MNKQQIAGITFVVSVLIFNTGIDDIIRQETTVERRTHTALTQSIASILIERGLEGRVANERAAALLGSDPASFTSVLHRLPLLVGNISKEELLNYFAESALHRQHIELGSYEQLIHLYHKITHTTPDKKRRESLAELARQNSVHKEPASKSQNFIV